MTGKGIQGTGEGGQRRQLPAHHDSPPEVDHIFLGSDPDVSSSSGVYLVIDLVFRSDLISPYFLVC